MPRRFGPGRVVAAAAVAAAIVVGVLWWMRGRREVDPSASRPPDASAATPPAAIAPSPLAAGGKKPSAATGGMTDGAASAGKTSSDAAAATYPPVEGIVVDVAGKPVAGAFVEAWSAVGSPAVTDSTGRFSLPGRERGYLLLHAWAKGLVSESARQEADAGSETRIVLTMARPLRVTVRRAADKSPVADARVLVVCGGEVTSTVGFARQMNYTSAGRTAADGTVTLDAREGTIRCHVFAKGFGAVAADDGYVGADGGSVEVLLGVGGSVVGRVLGDDGAPVAGAAVHVVCHYLLDARTRTADDGSFRVDDVPAAGESRGAPVIVAVRAEGWAPAAVTLGPAAAGAERSADVRLSRGRDVSGVVLDADRKPVARADVYGECHDDSGWSSAENMEVDPYRAVSDESGRFSVAHVAAGEASFDAYRRSLNFHAGALIKVAETGPMPLVELVESRRRGTESIRVRVVDAAGSPLAGACVDANDPAAATGKEFLVRECTDSEGRATLGNLPALPVRLDVVLERFPYFTVSADLAAPHAGELEIRMPAGRLEGRILLEDGSPARVRLSLACRPVWAISDRERGVWPFFETDADGRFAIEGLSDGVYSLDCRTGRLELLTGPRLFHANTNATWTVGRVDPSRPPLAVELVDAKSGAAVGADDEEPVVVEFEMIPGTWEAAESVDDHPGWFAVRPPADAGRHRVRIRRSGYLEAIVPDVPISAAGPPARVPVTFDEGAVVAGRILAEDGRPVPAAELAVGGHDAWRIATREDGRFRLTGLADGEVEIVIEGRYVFQTAVKAKAARASPTPAEFRVRVGGAVDVVTRQDAKMANGAEIKLFAADGHEIDSTTLKELPHAFGMEDEPDVTLAFFGPLAPGRYTTRVTWDGKVLPPVESDVRALDSSEVRVTPP